MEQRDFFCLFAETGEPLYWLLSRAENRAQPQRREEPASLDIEEKLPPRAK